MYRRRGGGSAGNARMRIRRYRYRACYMCTYRPGSFRCTRLCELRERWRTLLIVASHPPRLFPSFTRMHLLLCLSLPSSRVLDFIFGRIRVVDALGLPKLSPRDETSVYAVAFTRHFAALISAHMDGQFHEFSRTRDDKLAKL